MREKNKEMIIKSLVVILIVWVIGLIWCLLELVLYGQITHRVVDDIILLMFMPFVWKAIDVKIKDGGSE